MDPVPQEKPVDAAPAVGMPSLPAVGGSLRAASGQQTPEEDRRPGNPLLDTVCDEPASPSQLLAALEEKRQALAAWEAELARREERVQQEEQTLLTLRVEVTRRQADLALREARLKQESSESPPAARPAGLPAKLVIRDIEVRQPEGPRTSDMTSANALFDDFAGPRSATPTPAAPPEPPKTILHHESTSPSLSEVSVLMADNLRLKKSRSDGHLPAASC